MIEKAHIERLLKLNGVLATASDEEIKAVLLHASWHEQDVQTALLVLRENTISRESHVDSFYKVFKSDETLKPEAISKLLGIDVVVTTAKLIRQGKSIQKGSSLSQVIQVVFLSMFFAGAVTLGCMWYLEIGMFHIAFR